ncbi:MAG: hypothetical protein ACQEXQ_16370 [Bacillota bacterium]
MSELIKIKMNTLSAGPEGTLHQGGIYSLPVDEAKELVDGKYAIYVEQEPADQEDEEKDLTDEEILAQLQHVGGGTYELPDGERVKGKEDAITALRVKIKQELEQQ